MRSVTLLKKGGNVVGERQKLTYVKNAWKTALQIPIHRLLVNERGRDTMPENRIANRSQARQQLPPVYFTSITISGKAAVDVFQASPHG